MTQSKNVILTVPPELETSEREWSAFSRWLRRFMETTHLFTESGIHLMKSDSISVVGGTPEQRAFLHNILDRYFSRPELKNTLKENLWHTKPSFFDE